MKRLVNKPLTMHGARMANPRNSSAGGVFVALGALIGVGLGHYFGQTSLGLLAGVGLGAGIAALIWLREARRP